MHKLIVVLLLSGLLAGERCTAEKIIASAKWVSDVQINITSESTSMPKRLTLMSRSAAWFATERCPFAQLGPNDEDFLRFTELRLGFEHEGMLSHRTHINGSLTYAISNFNQNKIFFFEFPSNFSTYTSVATYIWSYKRPQYLVHAGRTTRAEIMECLHAFKLAGYADKQVGLNSFGQPIRNKEIYASFADYKRWARQLTAKASSVSLADLPVDDDDDGIIVDDGDDEFHEENTADELETIIDSLEGDHSVGYYIAAGILIVMVILTGAVKMMQDRKSNSESSESLTKIEDGSPFKYNSHAYETDDDIYMVMTPIHTPMKYTYTHDVADQAPQKLPPTPEVAGQTPHKLTPTSEVSGRAQQKLPPTPEVDEPPPLPKKNSTLPRGSSLSLHPSSSSLSLSN